MSAATVHGGPLWSRLISQHSSTLATITFLAEKSNSDLCCTFFTGAIKQFFKTLHRIASVQRLLFLLGDVENDRSFEAWYYRSADRPFS